MDRYKINFFGIVQGVGFRYFIARTARLHGLTGSVQNLDDGSVEVEIQGSDEQFANFIARVREGNGYAVIRDFSVSHMDLVLHETSFVIE